MRRLGAAIIVLLILAFGFLSYRWIKHRIEYAITDAVFIRAENMSNIAFEVGGRVVEVHRDMGDRVKRGEVIARLEPEDYRLQLEVLQGRLSSMIAQKEALELQLRRSRGQIDLGVGISKDTLSEIRAREEALNRQIQELEVQTEQAKRERDRMENLLKEGLVPGQRFEQVDTAYRSLLFRKKALEENLRELRVVYSKAQKDYERAELERLRAQELKKQVSSLEEEIRSLDAQLQKAQLDLQRTELRSPMDGLVAKRFISVGDTVRPGQPAFSLVDDRSLYVEALLEETKLGGIRPGSKAYIRLDAYRDLVFEGVVEEISPASAATFALVPRDISAGEFTKVVQRIPVKIKITRGDLSLLRVGMGGRVEIRRE